MPRQHSLRSALGLAVLWVSCSWVPTGSDESVQDSVSLETSLPATTQPATTLPETTIPTTTLPDTVAARCNRIASHVIKEFVASFNDGGIDLNPYFATGDEFILFGDGQRGGLGHSTGLYDPEDRSTLIAYLHEVRRTRGPMTILSLKFTGAREYDPNAPWAPHGFKIEPAAPDAVRYAVSVGYAIQLDWDGHRWGKGSVDCGRRQIDVWALGSPRP